MKTARFFLPVLLFCIFCAETLAQPSGGLLELKKRRVYQNGSVLKGPQLNAILTGNPASAPEYESSKSNRMIGTMLSSTGVGLVLLSSVLLLTETLKEADEVNSGNLNSEANLGTPLALALVGLGIVIAGAPFNLSANKHLKKSITLYNSSNQGSGQGSIHLNLAVRGNRVGIVLDF
jgi:hypothetical protein